MAAAHTFPSFRSKINVGDALHVQNRQNWEPVLEKYEQALQDVSSEGSESSLKRHQDRGQLLRMSPLHLRLRARDANVRI